MSSGQGFVGLIDSSGDTITGGIITANASRNAEDKFLQAKWKSQSQIKKLRGEGRCFWCEMKVYNTNIYVDFYQH